MNYDLKKSFEKGKDGVLRPKVLKGSEGGGGAGGGGDEGGEGGEAKGEPIEATGGEEGESKGEPVAKVVEE